MKAQNTWKLITIPFGEEVNNILQQQYLAAQFIALVGRYLIPEKPDKSNINMQFVPEEGRLLGNQLPGGWFIALDLEIFALHILTKNQVPKTEILLAGKTFETVFQELKNELQKLGVDVTTLKTEQPYQLSFDALQEGRYFTKGEVEMVNENIRYRQNANLIINELAAEFKEVEPVRIWPHHFDTGTFATIARNEKGVATKTIGLGWAIQDKMVSEPYFYLSFWSKDSVEIKVSPSILPAGKWMMPDWNGAVLTVNEILHQSTAGQQYALVKSFFESGINQLIRNL